jgi:uncharacterized protein YggU (UPF0235/DUF167 family)
MYIHVKVTTGAREEAFEKVRELHFVAKVKQKPERNQANVRVRELVASFFEIRAEDVRIVSGHHSPSKLLSIPDQG